MTRKLSLWRCLVYQDKSMLKRIYINNFRCLVNFELTLDSMNLFLGANGTGKTTLFFALLNLQQFIVGNKTVTELFKLLN